MHRICKFTALRPGRTAAAGLVAVLAAGRPAAAAEGPDFDIDAYCGAPNGTPAGYDIAEACRAEERRARAAIEELAPRPGRRERCLAAARFMGSNYRTYLTCMTVRGGQR